MNVTLQPIDQSNRDAAIALTVTAAQSHLIATNSKSIEWAAANPQNVPVGIYADGDIVGFAMFEPRGNNVFSVHRFMIDGHHQRKGIGIRAMEKIMDEIASLGGKTIYLSFRPENDAAKSLYEKLHFQFHEKEPDGELVYRFGPVHDIAT